MDPERWRTVRAAFDELIELTPGERAIRLATLGAGDPELRQGVETLIEADSRAEQRLAGRLFGSSSDPLGLCGRTLAHFRVLEPLGSGGMGVVYAALDTRLGRAVALKVPLPESRLDDSAKQRFLHEARSAATLDHPNVCSIYEVGESEDGVPWMAMGLCAGETLKARLAREGALPPAEAVAVARQIARGLAAAHQAGIVHRDLKPGNLMLLPDGTVKILDFGLAKIRDLSLTGSGTRLGTAAYMSPEQVQGAALDGRADLWALGVVLYEMLTGRQPFQGDHEVALAHAILHRHPPRPSRIRTGISPAIEDVVLSLLEKRPARRPASAHEVDAALAAVEQGRTRRRSVVLRRWMRSWPHQAAAMGALALGAAGLIGYRGFGSEPARYESNLLAVAPFEVPDTSLQLWREGLVDILSLDLDGAGPLRTVPQTVVLRRWSGRADGASAGELGRRTGAELVVFGHLMRRSRDSVGLRAAVLDRSNGATFRDLEVVGEEERMGELAESLGVQIIRAIGRRRAIGSVRDVTIAARSLSALKEFLRGEQFFRHGLYDSALAHYDQAVTRDPEFALALRRAAQSAEWSVETRAQYRAISEYRHRAVALNRGLAPRDSLMLLVDSLAMATAEATRPDALVRSWFEIHAVLEEAARSFPDDPNIWYELGERLYHSPPPLGGSPGRSLEAFEHAIALDPGFSPAYEHVVELAFQLRQPRRAARYARDGAALGRRDEAPHLRITAWILDSGLSATTVARTLAGATGDDLFSTGTNLKWATDSGEATVAVLRRLATGNFDQEAAGPLVTDPLLRPRPLAFALAFRGRLRDAAQFGAAPHAAARSARTSAFVDPFLELALFGAVPDSVAHRAFEDALAPDADWMGPPIGRTGGPLDYLMPRYLRGAPWWLARRDTTALHRFADRAARAAQETDSPVTPLRGRYLHAVAIAYLALARGDSSQAVKLLEEIPDTLCLVATCFYEKVTLARLLVAGGEDRRAAALLDRWGTPLMSAPSAVLAALEHARIAERLADTATALNRYQFVAEAWRRADPELQPHLAEARAALARLRGSS